MAKRKKKDRSHSGEHLTTIKKTESNPKTKHVADTYNEFKEFEGKKYTGMKVGRSHKWYYDEGEWKETKNSPDLWEIHYEVTKRRAGKAPEGSGVPVGTEYHWYILAHQNVLKVDANVYETSMSGLKLKLAHKRAGAETWSASEQAQKKHLVSFLEEIIAELKSDVAKKTKKTKAKKSMASKKKNYRKAKTVTTKKLAA
jgi:hypothetical protein